jgi:hypothetical protein
LIVSKPLYKGLWAGMGVKEGRRGEEEEGKEEEEGEG